MASLLAGLLFSSSIATWANSPAEEPSDAELIATLRAESPENSGPVTNASRAARAARQHAALTLGGRGSAEGLQVLLALGDVELINDYASETRLSPPRTDAQARPLVALLASRYLSFGAGGLAEALAAAHIPGLQEELAAMLPSLPSGARDGLALALAGHHQAAATPYVKEILGRIPPQSSWYACKAMAAIGTAEALAETVRCLRAITRSSASGTPEILGVLGHVGGPLDLGALKAALPDPMPPDVQAAYVRMVADRERPPREYDRSKELSEEQQRLLSARGQADLDRLRTSDPERYIEESAGQLAELRALADRYADVPASREIRSDLNTRTVLLALTTRFQLRRPQRAIEIVATLRKELARPLEAAVLALEIGDVYEFDLADPRAALGTYSSGLARLRKSPSGDEDLLPIRAWLIRALKVESRYLRTHRPFRGGLSEDEAKGFLGAAFLGVMFLGPDSSVQQGMPRLAPLWKALQARHPDPAAIAGALPDLPASHLMLLATLPLVSCVTDEPSVRAHLARNDPSGFWTASLVALVGSVERASALEGTHGHMDPANLLPGLVHKPDEPASALSVVARQIAKERGITAREPDPRFRSPDATWTLFLDSLRAGDARTAASCFSGNRRKQIEPWLTGLTPDELRSLADSHVYFQVSAKYGGFVEAAIGRRGAQGTQIGLAAFTNEDGEWRVVSGP